MMSFYSTGATPRVFLSTPISTLNDDEERYKLKKLTESFVRSVEYLCPNAEVRSEILDLVTEDEYEDPNVAAAEDFGAISLCSHFVLLYPRPLASSALMELGYALAMDVPCLIYARNAEDLPYLAKPADGTTGIRMLPLEEYGEPTEGLGEYLKL